METLAWIGLGSNLGDRQALLGQALMSLEARLGKAWRLSSLYESEPWGFSSPNWFLNQVAVFVTPLPADSVLGILLGVERGMGRRRPEAGTRYSSRPIDIDLLMLGQQRFEKQGLEIPHPRLHLRRFVLEPLCELEPGLRHPSLGRSMAELLEQCPDPSRCQRVIP